MKKLELQQLIREEVRKKLTNLGLAKIPMRQESRSSKYDTLVKIIETLVRKQVKQLTEATELDPDFGNLDQFIYANAEDILKNMERYGWDVDDIRDMGNPYDVAHLLGVDSRLVRDADLDYITKYVHGILSDMQENDR